MKRWMACLICLCMMLTAAAAETRLFTDSAGREVEIPATISKVAVAGTTAQTIFFALAPDTMVGLAVDWGSNAEMYIPEAYLNMPTLGQLYGTKAELNLETLLAMNPDVIVDVGEGKPSIAEDMDALQAQTNIPCVHIECTLATLGDAFRMAGALLDRDAAPLADYCDEVYAKGKTIADSVEKVSLLYVMGETDLCVIAKGSYHAEVIDLMGNNLAVLETPSSKGTGNLVDMEQIYNWNPDYVIFAPDGIYDTIESEESWQGVSAIAKGAYAEVPMGPDNWLGFPPSAQRLLGMLWMAKLLYPEAADYDMYEETARFYDLFYHCDLTCEQYDALVANSLGKINQGAVTP